MNQRFEDYAENATRGLIGVSPQERESEAEEIRQHLFESARRHEAMGKAQAEAAEAAIR
jgi:hypothetical protein